MSYILIFVGGGLGSCLRYGIARLFGDASTFYPIATLIANLLACIVLGFGLSLVAQAKLSEANKLLLLTGFCGGFSTFSTFSSETLKLWTDGQFGTAVAYVLISISLGMGSIWWLTK